MAENDKYMWHKEREDTEKIRQLRGLKDARTESIPVRSTDGAMRSVVQEYDREFIDSPEGFGRAVIDHENGNMQK